MLAPSELVHVDVKKLGRSSLRSPRVLRFDEVIPGVLRWPVCYEKIGQSVHSHLSPGPQVEIDPIGKG